jgi:amino acid adenylation domain-containing protein
MNRPPHEHASPPPSAAPIIGALSPEKRALLERRLRAVAPRASQKPKLIRRPDASTFPLSFIQERIWFLWCLEPDSPAHNTPLALRLCGELHVSALEQALGELLRRHAVLRAIFPVCDGQPTQVIRPWQPVTVPITDLAGLPEATREAELLRLAQSVAQAPFDLSAGPVFRASLFRLGPAGHVLVLVIHHIAFDGWSGPILRDELAQLYGAFVKGQDSPLPLLGLDYGDYAAWQRQCWDRGVWRADMHYWQEELRGPLPVLDLPIVRPRPATPRYQGARVSCELDAAQARDLRAFCQREQVTPFMLLLAAYQVLLFRYGGQEDIIVGCPIAGRTDVDTERLIGCFINMLALRATLRGELSFRDFLGQTRDKALAAYQHQGVPFEKIVEALNPVRTASVPRVFQTLFNFRNLPVPPIAPAGLRIEPWDFDHGLAQFDLALTVAEHPGGISCVWNYDCDLFAEEDTSVTKGFDRETIEGLAKNYCALVATALREPDKPLVELPLSRPARDVVDGYEVTPTQLGMLLETLRAPAGGINVEQVVCELQEPVVASALRQAWECVVQRQVVLRSHFRWDGGLTPRQEVVRQVVVPWQDEDWRDAEAAAQAARLTDFLGTDRSRGFRLDRAPLLRLALFQLAPTHWKLVWSYHHALLDGRSIPLVLREVFACYEALRQERQPALPPAVPFRPLVDWLKTYDREASEGFWRGALASFREPTPLPFEWGSSPAERAAHEEQRRRLPPHLTARLAAFAQECGVTLNTLVQGAWALMLARCTGRDDVVFGVTVSLRKESVAGAEELIGLCINTLPLRVNASPEQEVTAWLREIRARWLALREHRQTPLLEIQSWAKLENGQPLFRSFVVFEDRDWAAQLKAEGEVWRNRRFELKEQAGAPLSLTAVATDELVLVVKYEAERCNQELAADLLSHLETLLAAFPPSACKSLGDVPLLHPEELKRILRWSAPPPVEFVSTPIPVQIREQARRTPGAIAVEHAGHSVTYRELEEHAERVARRLRLLGVGPEVLAGICVERSIDMVVGVLGIWKAGAAFVPLDPSYPSERLRLVLADSRAPVILTTRRLAGRLPAMQYRAVCLDELAPEDWVKRGTSPAEESLGAQHLAGVIYTSGSTGQPKGVMLEHGALANYAAAVTRLFDLNPADRVLQFASLAFDASAEEIWPCLIRGATLVLRSEAMLSSPAEFLRQCGAWRISLLDLPTAFWHDVVSAMEADGLTLPDSVRLVVIGGEAALPERLRDWQRRTPRSVRLLNSYGPTEATICATFADLTEQPPHTTDIKLRSVPIGRPIANVQTYVLDKRLQPLPIGVPGELYVGGLGLARGYLHRPDLTAERFVAHPFATSSGERLYKTGDLVRWRANENLEFLGRLDDQVKLRGFRIEPGEIEAVLREHPAVAKAVVLLREDRPGDKRLVCYCVPEDGKSLSHAELTRHVHEKLPEYMVPSAFVPLERLPLTPHGKVDRRALPAPDHARPDVGTGYVAPRNPVEEQLVAVWADLLGMERVGVHDNFFELGGHSLLAMQVVSRANSALQAGLAVRDIFECATPAGLAHRVDELRGPQGKRETQRIGRVDRQAYRQKRGPA